MALVGIAGVLGYAIRGFGTAAFCGLDTLFFFLTRLFDLRSFLSTKDDDKGMAGSNEQTRTGNEPQSHHRCVCYYTLFIVDADGLGYRYLVRRIQGHGFCYRIEIDALRTPKGRDPPRPSVLHSPLLVIENELFIIIQSFVLHSTQHDNDEGYPYDA